MVGALHEGECVYSAKDCRSADEAWSERQQAEVQQSIRRTVDGRRYLVRCQLLIVQVHDVSNHLTQIRDQREERESDEVSALVDFREKEA